MDHRNNYPPGCGLGHIQPTLRYPWKEVTDLDMAWADDWPSVSIVKWQEPPGKNGYQPEPLWRVEVRSGRRIGLGIDTNIESAIQTALRYSHIPR